MEETTLKTLVKTYFDSQQYRIRFANRLVRVQNLNLAEKPVATDLEDLDTELNENERFDIDEFKKSIRKARQEEKRKASVDGFGNTCKRALSGYEAIEKDLVKEMKIKVQTREL